MPLVLSWCWFGCIAAPTGPAGADGDGGELGLDGGSGDADAGGDTDAGSDDAGGDGGAPPAAEVQAWVDAYRAAHPGNGGKDWDIVACCGGASRTESSIQSDPDAMRLRSICAAGSLPVIPILAWEYGGGDHSWINPDASALVYCVYIPVQPNSSHWQYRADTDHVTADLYVLFPDDNPCKNQQGPYQVMACLGDSTNIEILVDTASFHDGALAGVSLPDSTTDLYLILPDGTRTLMYQGF